jgi:alkanesulfonate monooxygenase SsuD/methylene tetrahydromethanopterin reductase-like flavin-dependent oxidoreductase (luciferase family)
MQFGIFYIVQWHESRTQEQALQEALSKLSLQISSALMRSGWANTASRHGLLSGLFSFAGHVAARTRRMRIGTAVSVLPFHNPIVVAEEAAMLDILSGGRLNFGVGSGYQRQEFDGLGCLLTKAGRVSVRRSTLLGAPGLRRPSRIMANLRT